MIADAIAWAFGRSTEAEITARRNQAHALREQLAGVTAHESANNIAGLPPAVWTKRKPSSCLVALPRDPMTIALDARLSAAFVNRTRDLATRDVLTSANLKQGHPK